MTDRRRPDVYRDAPHRPHQPLLLPDRLSVRSAGVPPPGPGGGVHVDVDDFRLNAADRRSLGDSRLRAVARRLCTASPKATPAGPARADAFSCPARVCTTGRMRPRIGERCYARCASLSPWRRRRPSHGQRGSRSSRRTARTRRLLLASAEQSSPARTEAGGDRLRRAPRARRGPATTLELERPADRPPAAAWRQRSTRPRASSYSDTPRPRVSWGRALCAGSTPSGPRLPPELPLPFGLHGSSAAIGPWISHRGRAGARMAAAPVDANGLPRQRSRRRLIG